MNSSLAIQVAGEIIEMYSRRDGEEYAGEKGPKRYSAKN